MNSFQGLNGLPISGALNVNSGVSRTFPFTIQDPFRCGWRTKCFLYDTNHRKCCKGMQRILSSICWGLGKVWNSQFSGVFVTWVALSVIWFSFGQIRRFSFKNLMCWPGRLATGQIVASSWRSSTFSWNQRFLSPELLHGNMVPSCSL